MLHSQAEQKEFQCVSPTWIGLHRVKSGWLWIDGSLAVNLNFISGNPDNSGGIEDCVEVLGRGGKWNDLACYWLRDYSCESLPGRSHYIPTRMR